MQCSTSATCLKCFFIESTSNPAGNYWPFRVSWCDVFQGLLYSPRSNVPKIIFFKSHSLKSVQFSSVAQSCQTLCNPMTEVYQASLSITNSQSRPKSMSIESVMPSKHFILWRPLLLLPSIFTSIRVFSNESALHIRWPKYWSFSFNISPSNEH